MSQVAAHLRYYRCSPRKVRVLTNLLKGKKAHEAISQLTNARKRSTLALVKLIQSAMANAKHNFKISEPENLFVSSFTVNEGPTLKRYMPRARGSVSPIKKRMSHVTLVLSEEGKTETLPRVKMAGKKKYE